MRDIGCWVKKFLARQEEKRLKKKAELEARTPRQKFVERSLIALGLIAFALCVVWGSPTIGMVVGLTLIWIVSPLCSQRGRWKRSALMGVVSLLSVGVVPFFAMALGGFFFLADTNKEYLKSRAIIESNIDQFSREADQFAMDLENGFVGILADDFGLRSIVEAPNLNQYEIKYLSALFSSSSLFLEGDHGPNDLMPIAAVVEADRMAILLNVMATKRRHDEIEKLSYKRHGMSMIDLITRGDMEKEALKIDNEVPAGITMITCALDKHGDVIHLTSNNSSLVDLLRYEEAWPLVEACEKYGSNDKAVPQLPRFDEVFAKMRVRPFVGPQ